MGGHFYRGPSGDVIPAVAGNEFDLVVSLYRRDGHGPAAGIADHVREVPDAALSAAQLADVCELAEIAAAAVRDGRKVLVRCHSGFNRSGLVIVQALGHLGYSVDDAIFLVRYHRSKWALNNDLFVDYLTTGLDVTALLTDLTAADLGPGNDDSAFAVQGDDAFGIFTGQADGVDVLRLWLFRAKLPRIQR